MTQVDFTAAQGHDSRFFSEQAVAALLMGAIVVAQSAWLGLIGYGAWRLLFG